MRLRNLPLPVHDRLTAGEITMGHARALLGAEDPLRFGRMIVQRGLSVRETERLVKKAKAPARTRSPRSGDRVEIPTFGARTAADRHAGPEGQDQSSGAFGDDDAFLFFA